AGAVAMPISKAEPAGGFTTLELIAVIVVMGLLLSLVVIPIGDRSELKAKAACRQIGAMIRAVRREAALARKSRWIMVDIDHDSISSRRAMETADDASVTVRIPQVLDLVEVMTLRTTHNSGLVPMEINRYGIMESSELELRDRAGRRFTILIPAFSPDLELKIRPPENTP
ncbi:hypothetical protein JW905_19135, partial [bacterium]|nr:hypothetical protein [candidate division CSSED10-310 bacterium]